MKLPAEFDYLNAIEGKPRIIVEAIPLYGIKEGPGKRDNPQILAWSKETGIEFPHDEIAWCGFFMALVVKRAGWTPVAEPLWALNWQRFGKPADAPSLGDVMVFNRYDKGGKLIGGHVGPYVGEDEGHYYVLSGNTGNAVDFDKVERKRLVAARRPIWRIAQPKGVRPYRVDLPDTLPKSEA